MTGSTLGSDIVASTEEIGTLSIITEQRIIRRVYLNDRMIPTEVDTCSLVSIVMSDDPKLNRMLRIRRKLNTCPLIQQNQRMEDVHENKLIVGIRAKPEPHTIEDGARKDRTSNVSMSPDPNIVFASDDPRRGGRFGCSDKREPKVNPPSTSQRHTAKDCRKKDSQFPKDREAIGSS